MKGIVRQINETLICNFSVESKDYLLEYFKSKLETKWKNWSLNIQEDIKQCTSLEALIDLLYRAGKYISVELCLNCSCFFYSPRDNDDQESNKDLLSTCPCCRHRKINTITNEALKENEAVLFELKKTNDFFKNYEKERDFQSLWYTIDLQRVLMNQFTVTLISIMENHLKSYYCQLMNLKYIRGYGQYVKHFEKTVKNDFANIEMASKYFKELDIKIFGENGDEILSKTDMYMLKFIQVKRNIIVHNGGINDSKIRMFFNCNSETFKIKDSYLFIYTDYFYPGLENIDNFVKNMDDIGEKTQLSFSYIIAVIEVLKKLIEGLNTVAETKFVKSIDNKFKDWEEHLNLRE